VLALQINPVVVRVVEAPTPETTVADILIGAVGLVGFVALLALVVGVLTGGLFILFRIIRDRRDDGTQTISASPLTR
jgi:hypothetical protein